MNDKKLINTPDEAIECIKNNYPTSGYYMLREALDMAITALKEMGCKCE
jgi:hypothetical protein